MALTFLPTSLLVTAAIALPHIALARYFGISLSPRTIVIPEPLLSLLILATISSLTFVFLKPIVLNLVFGSSPTSKPRLVASWVSSNVQWLAFALLWNELLGRWPCPPGREEQYHQDEYIFGWRIGSGGAYFFALVILNLYHGDSWHDSWHSKPRDGEESSIHREEKQDPVVGIETAKE